MKPLSKSNFLGVGSWTNRDGVLVNIFGETWLYRGEIDLKVVNSVYANETVQALSDQYGLKVDPTAKVETLSVGIEQRIETFVQ